MYNIIDGKSQLLDDFNHNVIAKKIAQRMKQRRLLLNLTQVSLSKKSGVSLGSLKRFENKYKISLEHLLQIALVLDGLGEFNNLFPENNYKSIDEIIRNKKMKKRKRARNV